MASFRTMFFLSSCVAAIRYWNFRHPTMRAFRISLEQVLLPKFSDVPNWPSIRIRLDVVVLRKHRMQYLILQNLYKHQTFHFKTHTKFTRSVDRYSAVCSTYCFSSFAIRFTAVSVSMVQKWFVLSVCWHSKYDSSFTFVYILFEFSFNFSLREDFITSCTISTASNALILSFCYPVLQTWLRSLSHQTSSSLLIFHSSTAGPHPGIQKQTQSYHTILSHASILRMHMTTPFLPP